MMSDGESKAASEFTDGRLIKNTHLINNNMNFNQPDSALLKNIDAIIKKEGGHDQPITARIRSNFQKAMFQSDLFVRQSFTDPSVNEDEVVNIQKIYQEVVDQMQAILYDPDVSSDLIKLGVNKFGKMNFSLLNNTVISFEEMAKKTTVFEGTDKPKALLTNIFQRFDVESRSLLLKLYSKHMNKYQMKTSLSLAEAKAPFKPSKLQRKTIKKINIIFSNE